MIVIHLTAKPSVCYFLSDEVQTQNVLRIAHGSSLSFRKAQGTGGIESAFGLTCVTYTVILYRNNHNIECDK